MGCEDTCAGSFLVQDLAPSGDIYSCVAPFVDQSFINLGVDISNDDTASEKGNVEELGSDHENGNGMAITNHKKKYESQRKRDFQAKTNQEKIFYIGE